MYGDVQKLHEVFWSFFSPSFSPSVKLGEIFPNHPLAQKLSRILTLYKIVIF